MPSSRFWSSDAAVKFSLPTNIRWPSTRITFACTNGFPRRRTSTPSESSSARRARALSLLPRAGVGGSPDEIRLRGQDRASVPIGLKHGLDLRHIGRVVIDDGEITAAAEA